MNKSLFGCCLCRRHAAKETEGTQFNDYIHCKQRGHLHTETHREKSMVLEMEMKSIGPQAKKACPYTSPILGRPEISSQEKATEGLRKTNT